MKIYTRTGDKGTTGLFGGGRVPKDHERIAAYGSVDELNAAIGVARAHLQSGDRLSELNHVLRKIQSELFVVGADLATPPEARVRPPRVGEAHVRSLEALIDRFEADLEPLKNFILPAGSVASAYLHLARTTARRSERDVVHAARHEEVNAEIIVYLNRLSDLLFVLARWANARADVLDEPWTPEES